MKIGKITTRNVGFAPPSPGPKRRTIGSTALFDDSDMPRAGWFGSVMFTLVEVEADNGTVGIGTAGAVHGGGKSLIDMYYAPLLIGEDPRRHEYLWQRMYRSTVRFGRSGTAITAISALDIACWDLHGKLENKPVYELLGGRTQKSVPCYVSRLYALDDLDELAKEAKKWLNLGFTRMKQRFGCGPKQGPEGMQRNVDLIRTVRKVVGDSVELAADVYMGWDVGYAIEMAKRVRKFDLSWIEEPLVPHEIESYLELKRRCPWQRWSCGEHSYGKWEFKDLIDRRVVDILQPDTNRAGGFTELMKICALAEAAGLPVVPHSNEMHNLHVIFSRAANVCPVIEYFPNIELDTGNELFWTTFKGTPEASKGMLTMTDAPGLGISIQEDVVSKLQVGERTVTR